MWQKRPIIRTTETYRYTGIPEVRNCDWSYCVDDWWRLRAELECLGGPVCICVCVFMRVRVCVRARAGMRACERACVCVHACTYVYGCIHVHTCMNAFIHGRMHVCTYVCTYALRLDTTSFQYNM